MDYCNNMRIYGAKNSDHQIEKLPIPTILRANSPNLMFAKFSCYTVITHFLRINDIGINTFTSCVHVRVQERGKLLNCRAHNYCISSK